MGNIAGSWVERKAVLPAVDGFVVRLGKDEHASVIRIVFGSIDSVAHPSPLTGAFLLPTNEFFDRECYKYHHTSLGAFVNSKFTGDNFGHFVTAVDASLKEQKVPTELVEKEPGSRSLTYGPGACVLLENPAGREMNVVLAAVTTKRANLGLRAEAAFIFALVKKLQAIIVDKRIREFVMPVMGSGEGGLRKEVALFMLVVAFAETMTGPLKQKLNSVTIVIHTRDNEPEIKRSRVRRILGVATAMF